MRRYVFALLGVALPVSGLAQTAPRVEISPTIGYLFGGNLWDRSTEGPTLSVGDHLDYGLRAGWVASPRWEFELDWTRVPTRLEFSPALSPIPLDIDYLTPRVAYHFATGALRPYIAAGFGVGFFDTPETGSKGYFTGTLAIGLKTFLTPGLGARIEARGFRVRRRRPATRLRVHRVRHGRPRGSGRAGLMRARVDSERRPHGRPGASPSRPRPSRAMSSVRGRPSSGGPPPPDRRARICAPRPRHQASASAAVQAAPSAPAIIARAA